MKLRLVILMEAHIINTRTTGNSQNWEMFAGFAEILFPCVNIDWNRNLRGHKILLKYPLEARNYQENNSKTTCCDTKDY